MAERRISHVLRKAADRIETDGLHKGSYFEGYEDAASLPPGLVLLVVDELKKGGKHPACDVFGAIYLEAEGVPEIEDAISALAMHGFGFPSYNWDARDRMVEWADDADLTAEDATALLRRTADAYDEVAA